MTHKREAGGRLIGEEEASLHVGRFHRTHQALGGPADVVDVTKRHCGERVQQAALGGHGRIGRQRGGASSINFTVILRGQEFVSRYLITHEFIKRLHERYRREGITIPFPIRTIAFAPETAATWRARTDPAHPPID